MSEQDNPRREFLRKTLTLIPVVTVASTGLGGSVLMATPDAQAAPVAAPAVAASGPAYDPTYVTAEEWAFVNAAVARLIPADEQGPGALEAGVPE